MNLVDQLRRDEGEVLYVYQDSKGYWTIGVGILVDKLKGGGLRPEESAFILNNRMKLACEELTKKLPWFSNLDEVRQAALLNMAHQLGITGLLGFPRMLGALRDQRWAEAETQALDSQWARSDSPARARRVARQLATGEWQ